MSKGAMEFPDMGDCDPGFQPGLTCDVEINNESGTAKEIYVGTAWALRELAAKIESGKLGSGFHPIKGPNGLEIGEVYLDYYATGPR
jgi:hypothetical protein